jgi:rare lipoprotein A
LEKTRIKDPITEVVTEGSYMKLGKAKTGQASRYASSWGTLNASRNIPRGGYAKVTNLENGKSVVVKINDYGPQSPERIIDLDYVSFSKLDDPGRGILPRVKVEQVLN